MGPPMRSARSFSACASMRITFSPVRCIKRKLLEISGQWLALKVQALATNHWPLCLLVSCRCWTSLADVVSDDFLPLALSFQDKFDRIAQRSVSAGMFGDVMGIAPDLIACIGDGDGKAAIPHDWQVDDIISDERSFRGGEVRLLENFFERS